MMTNTSVHATRPLGADATKGNKDPDHDGDDDSTEDGDTDQDYTGPDGNRKPKKKKAVAAGARAIQSIGDDGGDGQMRETLGEWFDIGVQLIEDANGEKSLPEEIMLFPEGVYRHPKQGKLDFRRPFHTMLNESINQRARSIDPLIDTDHDRGRANGWIKGSRYVPGVGTYGKVEWTKYGKENILSGEYKYGSPDYAPFEDPKSGKKWPVALVAWSLTNVPHLKDMPALGTVRLSEYVPVPDSELHTDNESDGPQGQLHEETTMSGENTTQTSATTAPAGITLTEAQLEKFTRLSEIVEKQQEKIEGMEKAAQLREERLLKAEIDHAFGQLSEAKIVTITGDDGAQMQVQVGGFTAQALSEARAFVTEDASRLDGIVKVLKAVQIQNGMQLSEQGASHQGIAHDPQPTVVLGPNGPVQLADPDGENDVRLAEQIAQKGGKQLSELSSDERLDVFVEVERQQKAKQRQRRAA